jgi:hypothetical protein
VLSPYPQTQGPINEFGLCWATFVLFGKAGRFAHANSDLFDRARAVYHPPSSRIGPGHVGESSLDPLEELNSLTFQPILTTPSPAPTPRHLRRHPEEHDPIRAKPLRRPGRQAVELPGVEAPAVTLIGDRTPAEAVADHIPPGIEGRDDHLGDVLSPSGEHQKYLGPDAQVRKGWVQDDRPDPLTCRRPARFAGQNGPGGLSQQGGLGRLAAGFAPFEDDEAAPCQRPVLLLAPRAVWLVPADLVTAAGEGAAFLAAAFVGAAFFGAAFLVPAFLRAFVGPAGPGPGV